jgi:hypothetical protein
MRKRIPELKGLIGDALQAMETHQQRDLMADLWLYYFVEHAKKAEDFDEFFYTNCKFALEKGETSRM